MWKIMIADDEEYMLEAMEKLIDWEKMNCKLIYKAKNGQELLERIKTEIPDIIITDIKMPLVTGIEIAQYVYEQMLPTKVIILSAYADFEYAQEAIDYDVCGYIVKTAVFDKLPEMMKKAIKKLSLPEAGEEKEDGASDDIFARLQKYIRENYAERLTLSQISKDIHANGSYLSRLYKIKTGQNLFDAINELKLERAKKYLAQGCRIYECAQMVGFEDVAYFSRVFKKYENCSPREYERKLHEEQQKDQEKP